jgi:hypothetical protein
MLKDTKLELMLMRNISEFNGMVLRNAKFTERYIDGRDILVLELLFSSKMNPAQTRTAVFALDKDFTYGENTTLANIILDEEIEASK